MYSQTAENLPSIKKSHTVCTCAEVVNESTHSGKVVSDHLGTVDSVVGLVDSTF